MVKLGKTMMVLALAGLAACAAPQRNVVEMDTQTHNGLQFGVPAGRVVEAHEDRLFVKPAQLVRSVDEIVIWTVPPPPLPAGDMTAGDDPAPHSLVVIEGGMGGPEYALSIPKRVGNREVTVRAYLQSEEGVPEFAEAWAVWRSLSADDRQGPT